MKLQDLEEEINRALTELRRARAQLGRARDAGPFGDALDEATGRLKTLSRDLERARLLGSGA